MTTDTSADTPLKAAIPTRQSLAQLWRDISAWFDAHYVEIAIATAAGVAIYLALEGLRRLGARLCAGEDDQLRVRAIVGRVLTRTKHWFMIILAAKLVASYAVMPPAIATTIGFLFTIAAVLQFAIWAREVILGVIEYRTQTSEHSAETLGSAMTLIRVFVTVGVFAIALVMVLDNLGADVTALVAGLGIGGIAIGLAAQGIFAELFAALAIIFDKPFRRGETIGYDDTTGSVEKIGLKSTRIRAITGEEKIISNALLLDKELTNYTRLSMRRIKFAIGAIYQTSPENLARIPALLRETVEAEGGSFVRAGFIGFGASSLDFEVEFDVLSPEWEVVYQARHRVGLAILARFNKEGIEFAYPTQTSFTAAPDGEMVMPYPEVKMLATDPDE